MAVERFDGVVALVEAVLEGVPPDEVFGQAYDAGDPGGKETEKGKTPRSVRLWHTPTPCSLGEDTASLPPSKGGREFTGYSLLGAARKAKPTGVKEPPRPIMPTFE